VDADLASRLATLVDQLVVPREEDGTEASLAALMPCEPAIGEVVVACWTDSEGGELVELVSLADGRRIDDPVALREALTLLAMVETIEELAAFDELLGVDGALDGWVAAANAAVGDVPDAPSTDGSFAGARAAALDAAAALAALAPGEARMARPQRLDELGALLRELDKRWTELELAAEAWCDALLAASGEDATTFGPLVTELWRVLGTVRRGPLGQPISAALHEAREAGASMAASLGSSQPPT
jgi:hypothetical protein